MGERSPKQCHKSITEELCNGPLIAMHFVECQLKEPIQQGMHVFWSKTLGNWSGIGKVAEQHCHLLPFAFQSASRGQNFLGKVFRGIGQWVAFVVYGWGRGKFWGSRDWGLCWDGCLLTNPHQHAIILI